MPRPLGTQAPEFSRPIEIDQIGPDGASIEIEADPSEREALARRFGLAGLDRLAASLTVTPGQPGPATVTLTFCTSAVEGFHIGN